ncbi:MAG: hypothetical protein ACI8RE_000305 [Ilumatobacter sp.]
MNLLVVAALGGTFMLTACATTVDTPAGGPTTVDVTNVPVGAEPALDSGEPIEGGVIIDADTPESTLALTGSASDLLPEMAIEMSRLSELVVQGKGDDEALATIVQIWDRVRPEIAADRPELINGIGATVEMARTAVDRTRPADADKAFNLLTDLVDKFTGES